MNGWAELRRERPAPVMIPALARPIRIGVGGPAGSGKTTLIWRLCEVLRDRIGLAVMMDGSMSADETESIRSQTVVPGERMVTVDMSGDLTQVSRDAASSVLAAVAELERVHSDLHIILIERTGTVPATIFSTEIADASIFVVDAAMGERIPRTVGAWVSRLDLLVMNTIDLGQATGVSPDELSRDVSLQLGDRPTLCTSLRDAEDVEPLGTWVLDLLALYRQVWANVPGVDRLALKGQELVSREQETEGEREQAGATPSLSPQSSSLSPQQSGRKLPRYDYECKACETRFDVERPMSEASQPYPCPFCAGPTRRVFSAPKLMFKTDPRDNRPLWHNHGAAGSGFSHSHANPSRQHRNLEGKLRRGG